MTSTGRYYLTDCGSLRGPSVSRGGEWILLRQDYVDSDERLSFGEFETKLAHLLEANAHAVKAHQPRAAASVRPQRNVAGSKLKGGPVNSK